MTSQACSKWLNRQPSSATSDRCASRAYPNMCRGTASNSQDIGLSGVISGEPNAAPRFSRIVPWSYCLNLNNYM
jgi:hypothetical protein